MSSVVIDRDALAAAARSFKRPALYVHSDKTLTAKVAGWLTDPSYVELLRGKGNPIFVRYGQRAYAPPELAAKPTKAAAPVNPDPKAAKAFITSVSRETVEKRKRSGVTPSSRFTGVHLTMPTARWEAQFRRYGKPVSLGTFDCEEMAARAFDTMMVWMLIHRAVTNNRTALTNFPVGDYADEVASLTAVTQDELIALLRARGKTVVRKEHSPLQQWVTRKLRSEKK